MDSDEVVFGCKDGIIDSVKKMTAAGAEAIALISTCVPEIIGEDLDAIISEAAQQVETKLIGVKVPQFKSNGSTSGGLNFYEALISLMEKRERIPRTVNLLGYDPAVFRREHPPKLLPVLRNAGIDLRRYFTSEVTVEDYANAPEAALNLVFSTHNIRLAECMRERFGIPYIIFQDIYSVADIDSALLTISETLNTDLQDNFAAERNSASALESEVSQFLIGKKFIMTYPFKDTLPLAAYLCRLGMEPLLINVDEYCPHNSRWTESILKLGYDPHICHMVNVEADAAVLNALPFDICIGKFKYIEEGRPCLQDMSDLAFMYDYTRTAGLLKMLKTEIGKTDELV
jgi:nitrogenase molybdenum-iron protein alpha/beta subunit